MKIRYTIEKINTNGVAETVSTELDKESIRIGRGAGADILLESSLVSLTHAVLRESDGRLVVEDLGSPTGVRVNNENVQRAFLKDGDKIKLGDVLLVVRSDADGWQIVEDRKEKEVSDQDKLQQRLTKLDIAKSLPSLTSLSLLLAAVVIGAFLVMPVSGSNKLSWSSGPLANHHKMLETNCEACHSQPFVQVRDAECKTCHLVSDHHENLEEVTDKHPELDKRCASCHMEHNGNTPEGIVPRHSGMCVECHGNLNQLRPATDIPDISSLAEHPEFHVRVQTGDPATPLKKVRLDDSAALKDGTPIKLNHELHLEPDIRGPNGRVTMQCRDCHELSDDLQTIKPISFEKHCRSCHSLGFDERLPGNEVPHGKPDEVINYVFAEYAKLLLDIEKKDPNESRRLIPGEKIVDVEQVNMARDEVQKRSRETEEMIFTKTGCQLCHHINEDADVEEGRSRFNVVKPNIPASWMPASIFDHGEHQQIKCESCHDGVRKSRETTDVLLPKINLCRDCHADGNVADKVKSDCVECHSYHDSLELPDQQRRPIQEIVSLAKPL